MSIYLNNLPCLQLARDCDKLRNSVQTGLTIYVSLWLGTQEKVSVIRIVLITVHIKQSRKLHQGLLKGWLLWDSSDKAKQNNNSARAEKRSVRIRFSVLFFAITAWVIRESPAVDNFREYG